MAENDMNNAERFEDIIRGIEIPNEVIRKLEMRDEGIVSHDVYLEDLAEEIHERYVKPGFLEIPMEDMEAFGDKANERWGFWNQTGTVSGKFTVFSDGDEDMLEALLRSVGTKNADGNVLQSCEGEGEFSVQLSNKQLVSQGVSFNMIRNEDGRLREVQVGYTFYLPQDTEGEFPLFATPDSLTQHYYDMPSPTEARVRLEENWPDQLEQLESILFSEAPLAKRLIQIADILKTELADVKFRKLVEMHVNEELNLDMQKPHLASVHSQIDYYDGVVDDESEWRKLDITGTMALFIEGPDVRFSTGAGGGDTYPQPYIIGISYNDDDDRPETVCISVQNMENLISTRSRNSLANRAIESMDLYNDQTILDMTKRANEVKLVDAEYIDDGTPEYIQLLESLEAAFQRVQKLSDEYLAHTFTTEEDAQRDADILLEKISEQLNGTIFSREGHLVELMGGQVEQSNSRHNLEWDESRNVYIHGVDPENPVRLLELGDKVVGRTASLYSVAEGAAVTELDDGVILYTPRVVLAVTTGIGQVVVGKQYPPVDILVHHSQALAPLDSSTDIQLTALEQYRDSREALQKAEAVYGKESAIVKRIQEIEEKVNTEKFGGFISIDPELISGLPIDLGRSVRRRKKSVAPAAAVLETLFAERDVRIEGDAYILQEDGSYQLDGENSGQLSSWNIVDVKAHQDGDEVMMLVAAQDPPEYRYIPMTSVSKFEL